jgi:hypothetical protein
MPIALHSLIPDADILLSQEPEELAMVLLECLHNLPPNEKRLLNPANIFSSDNLKEYDRTRHNAIRKVLMEAWSSLVRNEFLAPDAEEGSRGWYFITRKGERIRTSTEFEAFRKANLLPKSLLHSILQLKVWPDFARGEYDTAVFKAFKEVEVAVRDKGG